eukprot:234271_1
MTEPLLSGTTTNTDKASSPIEQKNVIQAGQVEEEEETKLNTNSTTNSTNSCITVAVTGASGFIAAHCIKQLLEKGYNVHGTVRGDPSSDKYKWLYLLSEKYNIPNKLQLYQADLLNDGSFTPCFKDCDYIFHVASPFFVDVTDPQKDLVDPAKNGTINVLNCALNAKNDKLKRIVITSSVAAVNGASDPNKLYTEKDWNVDSNLKHYPYSYSKTEAERAAWNWKDNNKTKIKFDIITVNPALVLGRHLNDSLNNLNESNALLTRICNGAFPARINVSFTVVDVRDVAAAHIFMIEGKAKDIANGRYICSNKYMALGLIMDCCKQYCDERKIKKNIPCCRLDCVCCWCLIMCVACCQTKGEADYLRGAVNKGTHYSNAKIKELGFEFRDNSSTMVYTLDYLHEAGFIGK